MRNLVRARAAAVETVKVHKQQVSAFLLRHGRSAPYKCQATPSLTRQGDTQIYEARASRSPGVGELQRVLEVAEPVAAALDVEDVGAVEQAIEEGGGQDLVAGEELGPVADALVGGDQHRAAFVPGKTPTDKLSGLVPAT